MKLYMEYQKDGWTVKQDLELPNDEKLAARILNSVRKYQADKEKKAAQEIEKADREMQDKAFADAIEEVLQPEEKPAVKRYSGNLICECSSCHKVRAFHSKYPLRYYKCGTCGEQTEIKDVAGVELHCEACGKTWHYTTNVMDGSVEASCPKCGKPLTAWWNSKEKVYKN